MKHLKTYKQLNELHSDTYYSAANISNNISNNATRTKKFMMAGDSKFLDEIDYNVSIIEDMIEEKYDGDYNVFIIDIVELGRYELAKWLLETEFFDYENHTHLLVRLYVNGGISEIDFINQTDLHNYLEDGKILFPVDWGDVNDPIQKFYDSPIDWEDAYSFYLDNDTHYDIHDILNNYSFDDKNAKKIIDGLVLDSEHNLNLNHANLSKILIDISRDDDQYIENIDMFDKIIIACSDAFRTSAYDSDYTSYTEEITNTIFIDVISNENGDFVMFDMTSIEEYLVYRDGMDEYLAYRDGFILSEFIDYVRCESNTIDPRMDSYGDVTDKDFNDSLANLL